MRSLTGTSPRRPGFRLVAVACGAVMGLLAVEFLARSMLPAVQIIRGHGLHSAGGVPLWKQSADRENRQCVEQNPARARILFFGSSITFGVGLEASEVFTHLLERRLNRLRPAPGLCVLNFAQPAFAFEQKLAVARAEVERYRPALVLWENWSGEWHDYRLIGDTAYRFGHCQTDESGMLRVPAVPPWLNRLLFERSRLYQRYAVASSRCSDLPEGEAVKEFADRRLVHVDDLVRENGGQLILFLAPALDRPFAAADAAPAQWQIALLEFARGRAIPAFTLQRELIGEDHRALRMDACCHFNAAGHRALARVMERVVLDHLPATPPVSSSHAGKLAASRYASCRVQSEPGERAFACMNEL